MEHGFQVGPLVILHQYYHRAWSESPFEVEEYWRTYWLPENRWRIQEQDPRFISTEVKSVIPIAVSAEDLFPLPLVYRKGFRHRPVQILVDFHRATCDIIRQSLA